MSATMGLSLNGEDEMRTGAKAFLALPLLLLMAASCSATSNADDSRWKITSWAQNTPDGIAEFGIVQVRTACDAAPETCVKRVPALERSEGIRQVAINLAMPRADAEQLRDYVARYAVLSATTPGLVEVGIDDYYAFMRRNNITNFTEVVESTRSADPRLRFGTTVYEDELDGIAASPSLFPEALLRRIDRIYLYLHYRQNVKDYARFVARARELFPNAEIFGGSYAYDRINYIACAEGPDTAPCSREREIDLFRQSLVQQVAMMRSGTLAGIEFYPGQFGREDAWNGWDNPRICHADRKAECIENTKEMRRIAAAILKGG